MIQPERWIRIRKVEPQGPQILELNLCGFAPVSPDSEGFLSYLLVGAHVLPCPGRPAA
jgi:hypothetical protein